MPHQSFLHFCQLGRLSAFLVVCMRVVAQQASTEQKEQEAGERPHEVAYWDRIYDESARAGVKTFGYAWQGLDLPALRRSTELGFSEAAVRLYGRVLVLGAGDAGLPEELFDAGCRNVTAVDFSPKLVAAMAERSHGVLWHLQDVRKLAFSDESFDVALDLGLLDAVAVGGNDQVVASLLETHRVLVPGGTYISVSTEPPPYRLPLFANNPTGDGAWETKVLFTERPRSLDPRVRRIDPALDMAKLSVYVSRKPGGKNTGESMSAEQEATKDAASDQIAQQPPASTSVENEHTVTQEEEVAKDVAADGSAAQPTASTSLKSERTVIEDEGISKVVETDGSAAQPTASTSLNTERSVTEEDVSKDAAADASSAQPAASTPVENELKVPFGESAAKPAFSASVENEFTGGEEDAPKVTAPVEAEPQLSANSSVEHEAVVNKDSPPIEAKLVANASVEHEVVAPEGAATAGAISEELEVQPITNPSVEQQAPSAHDAVEDVASGSIEEIDALLAEATAGLEAAKESDHTVAV